MLAATWLVASWLAAVGAARLPMQGGERIGSVLRWITAGESHGPALVAVLEGMVAGVEITTKELAAELARRRLGYGRGARMKFEADELEVIGGLRHGSPRAARSRCGSATPSGPSGRR